MEVGEGEAIAAELCRIGYVDYVLTEDMDTLVGGCPRLIRNCIDKTIKTKEIVSVCYHEEILKGLGLNEDQFIKYCILCGCDYCPNIPKVGNIMALKLIKKYDTIEEIVEGTNNKYQIPDNYVDLFNKSYEIFTMHRDKLKPEEIDVKKSNMNLGELIKFLVNDIQMDEKRVHNGIKKIYSIIS